MLWLYVLAVAIIGVIVVILAGRWDGEPGLREESPAVLGDGVDDLVLQMQDGTLSAESLRSVRLDTAIRGYRADQVDRLLEMLAQHMQENPSQR